ncbi:MAG TPA: DUF1549 and DUF1553 domain-containing protein [Verrucomicrobiae bacterium]|nr:DUF1549 and DUF1553 domain-containing protein [Verrucomicrobiae bacterium]
MSARSHGFTELAWWLGAFIHAVGVAALAAGPGGVQSSSTLAESTAQSAKVHWAFQPLSAPVPPTTDQSGWARTVLDRFILASLAPHDVRPAWPADKRTLLRRATYDLIGLPPTPEELDAFVADESSAAFSRVLERLLASPHYGEHWGRQWLDVVRYADTAGENTDHPLPHAWRYRNWVINVFNEDKPYDQFIREQIAGDLLAAAGPPEKFAENIIATGYLAIARRFGHDIDKDMHLTMEDTIDTVGKSVLGLTLGCARCHNHKYDPISARDYYGLYGIFESTRFAFPGCEPSQRPRDLVPLWTPAEIAARRKPFEDELHTLETRIKELNDAQTKTLNTLRGLITNSAITLAKGEFNDGGAQPFGHDQQPILVTVKPGEMIQLTVFPRANHGADTTIIELDIAAMDGSQQHWNLGSDVVDDFLAANPHADRRGHPATWCFLDPRKGPLLLPDPERDHDGKKGLNVWRNGDTPSAFVNASDQPIQAWTTLPARTFFVHPAPDGPVAVAWLSSVAGPVQISGRVADGHRGGGDGVAWVLEHAVADLGSGIKQMAAFAQALREPLRQRAELKRREPLVPVAYAVLEGKARNTRLQERGNPEQLGAEVPRKFLDLLGGQTVETTNQSGRLELARWLTSATNPLPARVMVNRIWQGHFGRGLVPTPNDFGRQGQPPTHPELLDWLAAEFIKSGWSMKAMHRLIMESAVYQQASAHAGPTRSPGGPGGTGAGSLATDYSAFTRRRLTAEELRDTLLVLSSELDRTPGQAHPFPPEDKWNFTQHGPFAAEYDTLKRSVYVMQKRNRRSAFFALFDGPDPNSSTARRDTTTVPTQALYFMNDPFVHARADKFAARILAAALDDRARLDFACREIFGRKASEEEQADAGEFLRDYAATCIGQPIDQQLALAWSAYARVLFGSNELLYLD